MSKRILVVEDDPLAADDLSVQLEQLGYEVAGTAATGDQAVQMARREQPGLVLMDVFLSGSMDGIEAAAEIQRSLQIPVVYLSAYSGEETLERAKITEPLGYILKPYTQRELHAVLSMAFYKAEMEKKLREAALLSATLMGMYDPVISTDTEGRVSLINRAAESLLKVESRHAVGRPLPTLLEVHDDQGRELLAEYLKEVLARRAFVLRERNAYVAGENGERQAVRLTLNAIRAGRDRVIGAAVLVHRIESQQA